MDITVKNLKIAEFASEETLCFEATVYVDGVRSFTAHNDGRGGPNYYHALPNKRGKSLKAIKDVTDYAKTLPLVQSSIEDEDDPSGYFTYSPNIHHLVDAAVEAAQLERELKRVLRKVAIFKDGQIYTYNIAAAKLPQYEDSIRKKEPDAVILNTIPLSESVAIYKTAM